MKKFSCYTPSEIMDIRNSDDFKILSNDVFDFATRSEELQMNLQVYNIALAYRNLDLACLLGYADDTDYSDFFSKLVDTIPVLEHFIEVTSASPFTALIGSILCDVRAIAKRSSCEESE